MIKKKTKANPRAARSSRPDGAQSQFEADNRAIRMSPVTQPLIDVLCAGSYVAQSDGEGSDLTADRALIRYAAATTRALALALSAECEGSDFDLEFDKWDAAVILGGLSALLFAGPKAINHLALANVTVESPKGMRQRIPRTNKGAS